MRRPSQGVILLLCAAAALAAGGQLVAEPSTAAPGLDVASLVGIGLAEAGARLGIPAEVFVLRGEQPWQDDVVFYYDPGLYLFWCENRVWQVRLDIHYGGEVLQLRMGAARERVRELLGEPWREEEDALVYRLEDRGYPLRLRLYFQKDLLVDMYCYRGDL